MKVLSIIGVVLFSLLFLATCEGCAEIMEILEETETIGNFSSILGIGNELTEFTDNIYAFIGISFISCIFGIILSIKGIITSRKMGNKYPMNIAEELTRLSHLKTSGVLTEDEFEAKKRELLM